MKLSRDLMEMVKQMTFGSAMEFLKRGFQLRRASWKKGYYIVIEDKTIYAIDEEFGTKEEWIIEQRHVFSEDWEFFLD